MSLAPTRSDNGVQVIYEKLSGDATMPNNITCWVESLPMLRGVYRKKIHTPFIASVATTATQTTYGPIAGTTINLVSSFKNLYVPLVRGTTPAGQARNMLGDSTIRFDTTAVTDTINGIDLDIETISY